MVVISWKCVANKQNPLICFTIYSAIPQAIPNPSVVDVPLPNSSTINNEFDVAIFNIHDASNISLINVDIPLNYASDAPTLVIIASIIGISADSHGTKHPICAINTHIAIYLIYVLLPPIFGPVIKCKFDYYLSISQSFDIQFAESIISRHGCLLSFNINLPPTLILGRTYGLDALIATDANDIKQSNSDNIDDAVSIAG